MAPEGQAHWEKYGDSGIITLAMMLQTSSGARPGSEDAARWADTHGLEHPVIADETGEQENWIVSGYPTFVVIDQAMTVVYDDLWPFDMGAVVALLETEETTR
ncbi:hypothetical protein L6R53_13905 [Myxococcota bacterium]|nr:hypothetical protein [Myxococcota bacterium]